MDGISFTIESELTDEQAALVRAALVDGRTYACEGCDCGRELLIARVSGGFDLTLTDPEFEAYMHTTVAEFADWLEYTEADGEGECWVSGEGNEGSIFLTDAQLADLRAWTLGEEVNMEGTLTITTEFDVTDEQMAALLADCPVGVRRYRSAASDAELLIQRAVGGFVVTTTWPDGRRCAGASAEQMLAWIDGGWINMDATTLADLRAWALGEVAP